MEKNKSETSESLQTLVQEAREAELRVEQLRTALAKAEIIVRDAWAAVGRLSFTLGCPTEPAAVSPAGRTRAVAKRSPYTERLNTLADRCYDILSRNGEPMLLVQIRYQIIKEADSKRRKRRARSILSRELRAAMGSRPLVFKKLGARHWTLHSSWSETQEQQVVESESPPPAPEVESELAPASVRSPIWVQAPELDTLREKLLLQTCVKVLREAPEPLLPETILAEILEKHPEQVVGCQTETLRHALFQLLRRKRMFRETQYGTWSLLPEHVPESQPDAGPRPVAPPSSSLVKGMREVSLANGICEVMRKYPWPLRAVDVLAKLPPSFLASSTTKKSRYQAVWDCLHRYPKLFQQCGQRQGWGLVGTLAAKPEPIPDLSADPRELLQTRNLSQLCFQILEASPIPVTIRDMYQIVIDTYPDRAAGYSIGHLQSSLAKALKRKPRVFKQIALGGAWTLLSKFKP